MGRREVFSILVTIAGFLLSDHHVEGQCQSYAVNAEDFCSPLTAIPDLNITLANALNDKDACTSHTLQEYACAEVDSASIDTLVSILKCFATNTNASVTPEAFNLLISKLNIETLQGVLDRFTTQRLQQALRMIAYQACFLSSGIFYICMFPSYCATSKDEARESMVSAGIASISLMGSLCLHIDLLMWVSISSLREDVKLYLLSAILGNINRGKALLSPGFLATWFQERLYPFLSAINSDILYCVSSLPFTCDGFQAIVQAFDVVPNNFAETTKTLIGNWISKYLQEHNCTKSSTTEFILSFYRGFRDFVSYEDYIKAWGDSNSSFPLDMLSSSQLAQYANLTNAFSSAETTSPILQYLWKKDLTYTVSFLDSLSQTSTSASYDSSVRFSLLETILAKLNSTDAELCKPNINKIFQVKIKFLLVAVNETILNQLSTNMDCSTFRDIFIAVDKANLSMDNQLAIFNYRLKYLTEEIKKSGGACSYGINSSVWLLNNIGASISYITFADIIKLNPSFNGYEALDIVTLSQTLDLIINSSILLEETQYSETQIIALTTSLKSKGFTYLHGFLIEFRKMLLQYNIVIIKNIRLRCLMLESIWEVLNSQFSVFSTNDWFAWFNEYLPVFLPCITREQLDILSVSVNASCSNFQVIVKGLDIVFDHMNQSTKVEVAKWIGDFLQTIKCDSAEWLKANFQRFSTVVEISTLIDINPDFKPLDILDQLETTQLGQLAVFSQAAQSSIVVVEKIFDVVKNVSSEKIVSNLGSFWDGLNNAYEKLTEGTTVTGLYLCETMQTSFDRKISNNLRVTRPVPKGPYSTVGPSELPLLHQVLALRGKYEVTAEENRNNVFKFFNSYQEHAKENKQCANTVSSALWIDTYYGEYFNMLSYEQIIFYYPQFNAYEKGVLSMMSYTQIGDMIVKSQTMDNYEECTKLFSYLKTINVTDVDIIIEQFTKAAIKSNKTITNVNVGKYVLENYLNIVSDHIKAYTEVQLVELFQKRITLLIKFVTPQSLNLIAVQSCKSLGIVVAQLNNVFTDLSVDARKAIADWILSILKQPQLNGCQNTTQSQSEWIQTLWLDFIQYAQYLDVISVYPTYNLKIKINCVQLFQTVLKPSDLAELLTKIDIPPNEKMLTAIFSSINPTNITEYVYAIDEAGEKANLSNSQLTSVKSTLLSAVLTKISTSISSYDTQAWKILFAYSLVPLLPYFNQSLLQLLPVDIDCASYQEIVKGFSNAYTTLPTQIKDDFYTEFIKRYLTQQLSSTGSACLLGTTSSEEWIKLNFGEFSTSATISELIIFYPNLNITIPPGVLNPSEVAELLTNPDILVNEKLITVIFSSIGPENITDYVNAIDAAAEKANLSYTQVTSVKEILLVVVFTKISTSFSSYDTQAWKILFEYSLVPLLPYFNQSLLQLLPVDIDCASYQEIVKGFSNAYTTLPTQIKDDFYTEFIKRYLTQQLSSTGSACLLGTTSSEEWIKLNFGEFSTSATISELIIFYPNLNITIPPGVLNPSEVAELLTNPDILVNEKLITVIFSSIGPENITEYVNAIDAAAEKANLSYTQVTSVKEILLVVVFTKISTSFSSYDTQAWKILFEYSLVPLLPYFNQSLLQLLPVDIDCASYQEIVKGFSNAYTTLPTQIKDDFYTEFIKRYLTQQLSSTGSACLLGTTSSEEWIKLNFGEFSTSATISELIIFYPNLNITIPPGVLNPSEVAELLTNPDILVNEKLITVIFSSIGPENITDYVNAIDAAAEKANLSYTQVTSVKEILLVVVFTKISTSFSSYDTQAWKILFEYSLVPLLPYFNQSLLQLLPVDIDCASYQEIVKGFSNAYTTLPTQIKDDFYTEFIKRYLTQQLSSTGSACLLGTTSSEEWIKLNFGEFSTSATISELIIFYPNLNITIPPGVLNPSEVAELLTNPDILVNEKLITVIFSSIGPENITEYVNAIDAAAEKANLSYTQVTSVKEILLVVVFTKISTSFSSYDTQAWKILFEYSLVPLLPYFNQSLLQLLPVDIDCASYQEIVKGFSNAYTTLPTQIKDDFYTEFIKRYLTQQLSSTGSACLLGTTSSEEWIKLNFGEFSTSATISELIKFYPNINITIPPGVLNPSEVAELLTNPDILVNEKLITVIFSSIGPENITDYVNAIDAAAEKANLSYTQVTSVKEILLVVVFTKISTSFSSYDTQAWKILFEYSLVPLLPYFNQSLLQLLPVDIDCASYQEIVKGFSNAYTTLPTQTKDDFYTEFIKRYLTQQSLSTGSKLKCDTNNNLQDFINNYFLLFSAQLSATDLVSLIPSEQLSEKLNTLQSQELSNILLRDENSTTWAIILSSYTNISKLGDVMDILKNKMANQNKEFHEAIFKVVWPAFLTSSGSLSASDLDIWFNIRLNDYLPLITINQLNVSKVNSASCLFYKNLVKTLSVHYGKYSSSTLQDIFSVFKMYLLSSDSKPRCYESSDSNANSWLFTYLGDYLTFCSAEDLKSFIVDEKLLQRFSVDTTNLNLVSRLNLSEDLKMYYAELIAAENPSIPPESIPANILCYVIDKLNIGSTNQSEALIMLENLKKCGITMPTDAFASLLTSVDSITAETLASLGSLAAGLLPSVILQKTTGSIIQQNLQSLSQYTWSESQASAIVAKLTEINFTFNYSSIVSLGKLVIGVKAHEMDALSNEQIIALATNQNFSIYMEQAPTALRQRFVQMIIKNTKESSFLVVPDNLASEIPPSQLLTSVININEINKKHWTIEQAQVFFQAVLSISDNYSELSAYVLQGFTGGAVKDLTNIQFISLIKSMTNKNVKLDSSKLMYIAKKILKAGAPTDFTNYPSDVLLEIGPSSYTNIPNCNQYFSLVGQSNIDLLTPGSSKRISLLSSAKTCLKISSGKLTKENLQVLGSMSCDLSNQEINNSDLYILTVLQSCSSFTDLQKAAIESQLIQKYGSPVTWTVSTLTEMGKLAGSLSSSILIQMPLVTKLRFFPGFLTEIKKQDKMLFSSIMIQLKTSFSISRADSCTVLTTDMISKQKDLLVVSYTSSELETCLSADVLKDNLDTLGKLEFTDDQLKILKNKLDKVFPDGVSQDYLMNLGNIARMYTAEEITKWNITTVDILSSLIQNAAWQSNDIKVNALVTRYLRNPSATLDSTTLTVLASYICSLNESQIAGISADDLRGSSKSPNISTCSQAKKNLIFKNMKTAYQPLVKSENAFYQILKPVISGATAEDLVQFAANSPEMDIATFATLNQDEVKKLSANNIKSLLGENVSGISSISNGNVVQAWILNNNQSEVNALGLDIVAGVKEPTPAGFVIIKPATATGAAPTYMHSVLFTSTLATIVIYINSNFQ
ncbi:uncharacterized protein O3C94_018980 [Discoglossus pictus]